MHMRFLTVEYLVVTKKWHQFEPPVPAVIPAVPQTTAADQSTHCTAFCMQGRDNVVFVLKQVGFMHRFSLLLLCTHFLFKPLGWRALVR
jgi:hypothetical protein